MPQSGRAQGRGGGIGFFSMLHTPGPHRWGIFSAFAAWGVLAVSRLNTVANYCYQFSTGEREREEGGIGFFSMLHAPGSHQRVRAVTKPVLAVFGVFHFHRREREREEGGIGFFSMLHAPGSHQRVRAVTKPVLAVFGVFHHEVS